MKISNIFSSYFLDEEKAIKYGFLKNDTAYELKQFVDNNLYIKYSIYNNQYIDIKVFDVDTDDEYFLFENEDVCDGLSYALHQIANEEINKILNNCFESLYIAENIDKLIFEKFKVNAEYPFKDDNLTRVYRGHKGKWFAIIMYIPWNKLKIDSKEIVPVMNIKLDPNEIISLIDNENFFECYHMNKRYWISIPLTKNIEQKKLINLIEKSYSLTNKN